MEQQKKRRFVVCYDESYVRDAQVFKGDPNDEDIVFSFDWEDASGSIFIGIFDASCEAEAVECAAEKEGCSPNALWAKEI